MPDLFASVRTPERSPAESAKATRSAAGLSRWSDRLLLLVGIAGVLCLAFLPQRVFTVRDEANYVGVAAALVEHHSLDILNPGDTDGLVPWVTTRNGLSVPQHPLGISFLAAPLVAVFGWQSCYFLALAIWLAGAWFFSRLLERERLPSSYVVLYLLFPPLLLYSRLFMADVPSATLCLAALYALRVPEPRPRVRDGGTPSSMRTEHDGAIHRGFTGRAGALLGMTALGLAFLVRPTNAIFVGPLAFVALRQASRRKDLTLLVLLTVVGALFLLAQLGLNRYYLGSPLAFSYSLGSRFGLQHLPRHLLFYVGSLLVVYPFLLFALLRAWKERRFVEMVCVTGGILFYSAYYFIDRDANPVLSLVRGQRFLLPYATVLLLFYAKMLHDRILLRQFLQRSRIALGVLSILALGGVSWAQTRFTHDARLAQEWVYGHTTGASDEVILYNVDSSEFLHGVFGRRNYRALGNQEAFAAVFADVAARFGRILVVETDHPRRRGEEYADPLAASGVAGFVVTETHRIGPTTFVALRRSPP